MTRGRGLDDAAGAVVVACRIMMFAVRREPCGIAAQRLAMAAGADRFAILPHIACGAMAQRPLGDNAGGMMPGCALDQLDVMRFLR